jgi:hypothetical protein
MQKKEINILIGVLNWQTHNTTPLDNPKLGQFTKA